MTLTGAGGNPPGGAAAGLQPAASSNNAMGAARGSKVRANMELDMAYRFGWLFSSIPQRAFIIAPQKK
jgi:hypothetical protein